MATDKIFCDDTPLPVLDRSRKRTRIGRLWCYAVDDRPWQGPAPPAVVYLYAPDRRGVHLEAHLGKFRGVLQVDGCAGYDKLAGPGRPAGAIKLAYCLAHARQEFFDVHKQTKDAVADEALRRIGEVYAIEARIRGNTATERAAVRQAETKPLMDALWSWLMEQLEAISVKSSLARAIRYTLGHWKGLTLFLSDGPVEVDNNTVERGIRPIPLGRKIQPVRGIRFRRRAMGRSGVADQHGETTRYRSSDLPRRCARSHRLRAYQGERVARVAALGMEGGAGGRGRMTASRLRPTRTGRSLSLEQLDDWFLALEPPARVDGVSMLDGYLTAIIIGPRSIPPDEWFDDLFGARGNIVTASGAMLAAITSIVARFNAISEALSAEPPQHAPIFRKTDDGMTASRFRTFGAWGSWRGCGCGWTPGEHCWIRTASTTG